MVAPNTRRKRIAQVNIERCFPELSPDQRDTLVRQHFQSFVLGIFESGISWWWSIRRFDRLVSIKGLEYLEALDGQGALLLAFHFTNLDIGAGIVTRFWSADGVYKPHKNAVLERQLVVGRPKKMRQLASDEVGRLYETSDLRGIIRALKRGRVIWYAPDQDFGRDRSIFVPFFNIQTATITATSKLVKAGGAKVVPMVQRRLPDNKIEVEIMPPLDNFPGAGEEEDTRRISELNEKLVKELPADYLWVHRRFKTRPEGESSFY